MTPPTITYPQANVAPLDPIGGFVRYWIRWFQSVWLAIRWGLPVYVEQASLPANLGKPDAGSLFYVTDFAHFLIWNGAAYEAAPGERMGGFKVVFVVGPDPATGWHVCDGTTVSYLKPDGTLGTAALPTEVDTFFRL